MRRTAPRLLAATSLCVLAACAKSDEQWTAQLEDPDPFQRGLAALALMRQAPNHESPATAALFETIDRPDLGLAEDALHELQRAAPEIFKGVLAILRKNAFLSMETRQAGIETLLAAAPEATSWVAGSLAPPGRPGSVELGIVLIRTGPAAVHPISEVLVTSPDPELRRYAAVLLEQLGPASASALPRLEEARADPDPGVREAAASAARSIRRTLQNAPERGRG